MYAYVVNDTIQGVGESLDVPDPVKVYRVIRNAPCVDNNDLGVCRDKSLWELNHDDMTATVVYKLPAISQAKGMLLDKLKELRKQYESSETVYLIQFDVLVGIDDKTALRLSQCAIEAQLVGESWSREWKCLNGWRTINSEILRELQLKIGQRLNALFKVERSVSRWIQEQTDVMTLLETSIQSLWESEYEKTLEAPDP